MKVVPPTRLRDTVAAEVRAEMGRRAMSQVTLAGLIGMSQQSLSERLRGKTPFTTDDLEKVAGALGVHPATLLGGLPNSPQPTPPATGRYREKLSTSRNGTAPTPVVASEPGSGLIPVAA